MTRAFRIKYFILLVLLQSLVLNCSLTSLHLRKPSLTERSSYNRQKLCAKIDCNISGQSTAYLYYINAKKNEFLGHNQKAAEEMERAILFDNQSVFLRLKLAGLYFRLANPNKCLEQLKIIVEEIDSGYFPAYLLTARVYLALNKKREVIHTLEILLAKDPTQMEAYLILGGIYIKDKDYKRAENIYQRMILNRSGSSIGYYKLGYLNIVRDNLEAAEKYLLKAFQLDPTEGKIVLALQYVYEVKKDFHMAIQLTLEAMKYDYHNPKYILNLANYYHNIGDVATSRAYVHQLIDVNPEHLDNLLRLGNSYYLKGKYTEAREIFLKLKSFFPKNRRVDFYLGRSYQAQGKLAEAEKHYKMVSRQNSLYPIAVILLSMVYQKMDRKEEAVQVLKEALTTYPNNQDLYEALSTRYEKNQMTEKAVEVINDALNKFPKSEQLLYSLALLYEKQQKKAKSMEIMQNILQINPDNPYALNYIGYTYAEQGENLELAEKMLLRALSVKPDDAYILDSLGWVYYRKGEYKRALLLLLKAVQKAPLEGIIIVHLADIYLKMGELPEAQRYFRQALKTKLDEKIRAAVIKKLSQFSSGEP